LSDNTSNQLKRYDKRRIIQALGHAWITNIANYTSTFPLTDYSQVAETYSQAVSEEQQEKYYLIHFTINKSRLADQSPYQVIMQSGNTQQILTKHFSV